MATTESRTGLAVHGIETEGTVYWNPSTSQLYTHALERHEGRIAEGGPLAVDTGKHTGRSPKDKFVVREPGSEDRIWWGDVNADISEEHFEGLREKVVAHLGDANLYVVDAFAGADPKQRVAVRIITRYPYHALFARTMFIDPTEEELRDFVPQALVLHAPALEADPATDGTRTGTFVVLHPSRQEVLIGGSFYAGEIKKSIFTLMNDRLPLAGVFPMHCSANVGDEGDVAIFFGLSGTGKTTLSADPERSLIGDDEHGWGDDGVFNFEGGCYAKVINLSAEAEPEIFRMTHTFGTILENVVLDERGVVDLADGSKTENTRAAYKLEQIANALPAKRAGHPQAVIFLTADAFGILPPIARLTRDQAMYWFLSGFTAKLAGTEIGVKEPQPTFSACFGAPFLPQHPVIYARLLAKRLDEHGAQGVAREHGLDRRPVRRGRADADPGDARAAAGRDLRRARRRRLPDGRAVRLRGSCRGARRRPEAARSTLYLGRSRCVRRESADARRDVPPQLHEVQGRRQHRCRRASRLRSAL